MLLWLDPNIERYANDELFIAFVVKEEMDKFDWDGKFNESKYFEVFFIRNCEYIDDFDDDNNEPLYFKEDKGNEVNILQ